MASIWNDLSDEQLREALAYNETNFKASRTRLADLEAELEACNALLPLANDQYEVGDANRVAFQRLVRRLTREQQELAQNITMHEGGLETLKREIKIREYEAAVAAGPWC